MAEAAFAQAEAMDRGRRVGMIAPPKASRRPAADEDEDREQFKPVRELRTQFIDYLSSKTDEIEEQKTSRHYYHGAQYTADQLRILRLRRQPPLTWNRINRKINGIVGLIQRQRSDPQALPRTQKSEAGANLATQVIRSVLDANDWKGIDPWCLLQACIDGVAGVQLVLTKSDQGDPDIGVDWVIGDEYFYDPKSYRLDFRDRRYEGISKWLDVEEAIELFPGKEDVLRSLVQGDSDMTTNADREYKWFITATNSVRLIEQWYKRKGKWCFAFYVSSVLLEEGISPFFDEKGNSASPFHMFSPGVDHDGDRYGFVRNLLGPQDSLNQSKSKALHLANTRRLIATKGAVDDVEKARIEYARPDGFIEINPGQELKPDDKTQDLAAFTEMASAAGQEIDSFANTNIAVLQGASMANISGRAIELLRQPGMAELGPFILANRQWKLGLYRGIWNTAQRVWTKERWLRMVEDDDPSKVKFTRINYLNLDQFGRPMIVNLLGSLDVDITLEEGPDVASLMNDTYDTLKGYPPGTFPPAVLIELSPMPRERKNRILQMMAPKPPPPMDPLKAAAANLALEGEAVDNAKKAAEARRADAQAQKAISESHATGAQTQLDATELQHRIWTEALQLFAPPAPAQGQQQQRQPQSTPTPVQQAAMPLPPDFSAPQPHPDGHHYVKHHPTNKWFRVGKRAA